MPIPPQTPAVPGMQATALDIIKGSMRAVTILGAGENPSADEANDYLALLNQMLDAFNAERLMIFTVNRFGPFSLTAGKQVYTLGTGGDINMPRPPRIEIITILNLNNPSQPTEIGLDVVDEAGWAAIPVKNIGGPLPQKVWEDGGFPLRTLSYWPYPTVAVQTVIYAWSALTQFTSLAMKQTFPPGYLECLRFNLALRLDNAEISPMVAKMAEESKARIKSINHPILTMQPDPLAGVLNGSDAGAYNWLSDQPVTRGGALR